MSDAPTDIHPQVALLNGGRARFAKSLQVKSLAGASRRDPPENPHRQMQAGETCNFLLLGKSMLLGIEFDPGWGVSGVVARSLPARVAHFFLPLFHSRLAHVSLTFRPYLI